MTHQCHGAMSWSKVPVFDHIKSLLCSQLENA